MAGAVERARADLDEGRLWQARDRLDGAHGNAPTDQAILDLLGLVRMRMGDEPAAGLAWFLTERDDELAQRASAALAARYGSAPGPLIAALKVRAPIDDWPPRVQERLRQLQRRAREDGIRWEPRAPSPRDRPPPETGPWPEVAVIGFIGFVFVLGLGTLVYLVVKLVLLIF